MPGVVLTPPMTAPSNAIIVHGKPGRAEYYDPSVPSSSNHHWLPWLAKQLIVRDVMAHTPEMPYAYAPDYPAWCREFERYDIGPRTMLVGHSCGAGFLVRWLSEHPDLLVDRVALVAPWLDPDRSEAPDFFDFTIDAGLAGRARGFLVLNSDDDGERIQGSVRMIRDAVPGLDYHEFHGHGHFGTADLGGPGFSALLDLLLPSAGPAVTCPPGPATPPGPAAQRPG